MNLLKANPADIEIGVVGIGLMGSSIIVCLLAADHKVKAIAPIPADYINAKERIKEQLIICSQAGLLANNVQHYMDRLEISMDYACLATCSLVLE